MANKALWYNKGKCKKRKKFYTLPNGARIKCTNEQYKERVKEITAERTTNNERDGKFEKYADIEE